MSKINFYKVLLIGFVCLITVLFQNCSGYMPSSKSQESVTSAPSLPEEDLRPLLSCTLKDNTERVLRRISNISNSDETSASVAEGMDISIDCADSMNYTGSYNITDFNVNFGSGYISSTTGKYTYKFPTAGTYTVQFKLRDRDGNELIKIIRILVKCSSLQSTLVANGSAINVTPSIPGFFTYSAQGVVSGGKPPYYYAWDFNGDTIIDNQPRDADYNVWEVWKDNPTTYPVHNLYSNLRKVSLIVRDSCNFTKTVSKDILFDLPRVAPTEFPIIKDFEYLQADIVRTSAPSAKNSINKATNVDFNSIQPASSPDNQFHVLCSYNNWGGSGSLQVTGQNVYGDRNLVESNQALNLWIGNITDSGNPGIFVDKKTFPIENMSYDIAQSQEVMTAYRFDKNATCSVTILARRDFLYDIPCEGHDSTKNVSTYILWRRKLR